MCEGHVKCWILERFKHWHLLFQGLCNCNASMKQICQRGLGDAGVNDIREDLWRTQARGGHAWAPCQLSHFPVADRSTTLSLSPAHLYKYGQESRPPHSPEEPG